MRDFPLDIRTASYVSNRSISVYARRAFVPARFVAQGGSPVPSFLVVDPGAPFSVIPFSLWHGSNIPWKSLGSQLTEQGGAKPTSLDWLGIRRDLGATTLSLVNLGSRKEAGPYFVVAKFPQKRHRKKEVEAMALLGMNFLTDNDFRLVLRGTSGRLIGSLAVARP
jgi:hypothetical protein